MNTLIDKLVQIEKEIADAKGSFWLFALLERDESLDKWDLIVSAPWLQEQSRKSLDVFTKKIGSSLDPPELMALSRVVVLNPTNPIVQHFTSVFNQEHKRTLLNNVVINGMVLRRALIITSRKPRRHPASKVLGTGR